jgi:hypothetical protein
VFCEYSTGVRYSDCECELRVMNRNRKVMLWAPSTSYDLVLSAFSALMGHAGRPSHEHAPYL